MSRDGNGGQRPSDSTARNAAHLLVERIFRVSSGENTVPFIA